MKEIFQVLKGEKVIFFRRAPYYRTLFHKRDQTRLGKRGPKQGRYQASGISGVPVQTIRLSVLVSKVSL